MLPIVVRSAKLSDVQFLAWAILTATRSHLQKGWFDIALNRSEKECLEFIRQLTITKARSHWHYSRFLVAEEGVRLVAALSAFRARDAYPAATAAMTEVMQTMSLSAAESAAIWKRGAYMFACTMRPDDDSWVIENLATLPEFRGHGSAAALLSYAINFGRTQGVRQAQICLFIGNEIAERAYRKVGFRTQEERRDAGFEAIAGVAGLRRFVLEFGDGC